MKIFLIIIGVTYVFVAVKIFLRVIKTIKSGEKIIKYKNGEDISGMNLYLWAVQASLMWPYLPFRKKKKI